jgi:hypothetical protein
MFNPNAKPTRANVGKRLAAALEAIASAESMIAKMPADKNVATALGHSSAWLTEAGNRLQGNKGKRS